MDMEEKFLQAVKKAIDEKKFKNLSELCQKAGVDQPSLSRFMQTKGYLPVKGKKPLRSKPDLYFSSVIKILDALGATIVYPEDDNFISDNELKSRCEKLQDKLDKANAEIEHLRGENLGLKKIEMKFDALMDKMVSSAPVEIRQEKSSA